MNVSDMLKAEAIKNGLCSTWTDEWGHPTKEQLVDMYIRGLDFCILHNYPSNEFIKKHFGDIAIMKGVYTDMKVNAENPDIAILNGNCTGQIVLNGYNSRDIHVRHNSKVKIIVRDCAKAFIRVYDKAHAIVLNESGERSFVYLMGGASTISGNVLVRNYELVNGDWVKIKD